MVAYSLQGDSDLHVVMRGKSSATMIVEFPDPDPPLPPQMVPVDEAAAKVLKERTLTKLYNERPAWLDMLHKQLDRAVFAAYGLSDDIADDELLAELLKLNQARAKSGAAV